MRRLLGLLVIAAFSVSVNSYAADKEEKEKEKTGK